MDNYRSKNFNATLKSIGEIFKNKYYIPDYQREYAWGTGDVGNNKCVQTLFDDLIGGYNEFKQVEDKESKSSELYFLGYYIICQSDEITDESTYELNNGRQRLTTMFCFLSAIKRILSEILKTYGETHNDYELLLKHYVSTISIMLFDRTFDYNKKMHQVTTIRTRNDDYNKLLEEISNINDVSCEEDEYVTTGEYLTANAYMYLYKRCKEWVDNGGDIIDLCQYILENVVATETYTNSRKFSHKLYETQNNRGVGLSQTEMFKNRLFEKSTSGNELSECWQEFYNKIDDYNWNMDIFLTRYIFAFYNTCTDAKKDNEYPKEKDIYSWIISHSSLLGYEDNPVGFIKKMSAVAKNLQDMFDGLYEGRYNDSLYKIKKMGQTKARTLPKQCVVFMSAMNMDSDAFEYFIQNFDIFYFHQYCSNKPNKEKILDLEYKKWAIRLRDVHTKDDAICFVREVLKKKDDEYIDDYKDAIYSGIITTVNRYDRNMPNGFNDKAKHFIKRMAQLFDTKRDGTFKEYREYDRLKENNRVMYHIDHIIPRNPDANALESLHVTDIEQYNMKINRIGNFTILDANVNESIQDKLYIEKRDIYSESKLYITRSIPGKCCKIGNLPVSSFNEDIVRTYDDFRTDDDIVSRQKMLCDISLKYIKIE